MPLVLVLHLKRAAGQKDRTVDLRAAACMVTANERDSKVAVVHGCHSEGGDSIISAFSW